VDAPPPPPLGVRGGGWVLLQGLLLVGVALAAWMAPPWPDPLRIFRTILALILGLGGAALTLGGSRALGSALTPFPRPLASASLREHGVYRWVRHPISGGILLLVAGVAAWSSPWVAAPAILLGLLFDRKRRREVVWLLEAYPQYEAYRARVPHVFWPGVW
jgi:protein-S-isoprenylcysteine O-methyltransferase Ste14